MASSTAATTATSAASAPTTGITTATASARAASASASRPRGPAATLESAAPRPSATASTRRWQNRRREKPAPTAGGSSKVNHRLASSRLASTRSEVAEHHRRGLSWAAPTGDWTVQDRRIDIVARRRQRPACAPARAPSSGRARTFNVVPVDLARRTIGGSVIRRDSSVGLIDGRTSAFLNQV